MKNIFICLSLIFLIVLNTVVGFKVFESSSDVWLENRLAYAFSSESVIRQNVATNNGERLIPYGAIKGENDIDELIYTYTFDLSEDESFTVDSVDIEILKEGQMFSDDFELLSIITEVNYLDDQVELTVIVRLNTPTSKEAFNLLNGSTLYYTLDYSIK